MIDTTSTTITLAIGPVACSTAWPVCWLTHIYWPHDEAPPAFAAPNPHLEPRLTPHARLCRDALRTRGDSRGHALRRSEQHAQRRASHRSIRRERRSRKGR